MQIRQPLSPRAIKWELSRLQSQTQDVAHKISKKDYRNAAFVGRLANNAVRDGLGMLVADTGQIVFGEWKQDKLTGHYIYFTDTLRMYGTTDVHGSLTGFNVLSITSSVKGNNNNSLNDKIENENKQIEPLTVYCTFKNNRMYGKCIVLYNNYIYICDTYTSISNSNNNYKNNNYRNNNNNNSNNSNNNEIKQIEQIQIQVINKIKYTMLQLEQVCKQVFAVATVLSLHQFARNMVDNANEHNTDGLSKYKPTVAKYHTNKHKHNNNNNNNININDSQDYKILYGFATHTYHHNHNNNIDNLQFGFVLRNDEIVSVGWHSAGVPQGLATVYQLPSNIRVGTFRNGLLHGQGLQYQMDEYTNKYVYAKYDSNNNSNRYGKAVIKQGAGWPQQLIREYFRDRHTQSAYFDASYYDNQIDLPTAQMYSIYAALRNFQTNYQSVARQATNVNQKQFASSNGYNRNIPTGYHKDNAKNNDSIIYNIQINNNKAQKNINPNINSANKLPAYISKQNNKLSNTPTQQAKHQLNYVSQMAKQTINSTNQKYNNAQKYEQTQNNRVESKQKLTQNKQYQSLYSNFMRNKQNSNNKSYQYQDAILQQSVINNNYHTISPQSKLYIKTIANSANKHITSTNQHAEQVRHSHNLKYHDSIEKLTNSKEKETYKQRERAQIYHDYDNQKEFTTKRRVNTQYSAQKYSEYRSLRFNKM